MARPVAIFNGVVLYFPDLSQTFFKQHPCRSEVENDSPHVLGKSGSDRGVETTAAFVLLFKDLVLVLLMVMIDDGCVV